jgi:hypothetical protein
MTRPTGTLYKRSSSATIRGGLRNRRLAARRFDRGFGMGKPQESFIAKARARPAGVELEWLVAQLADEAEYWKHQAQLYERTVEELRVELYALRLESETSEAWKSRTVIAEDRPVERPKAVVGRGAQMALSVLALLSFLAYAAYRLVAG